MPNLTLPEDITPGTTATFETDVEAAWKELNLLSRDTGLRDITSMLINGWTATSVRLRRKHDRTFWEVFNLDGSAATSTTLIDMTQLPFFRPPATVESALLRAGNSALQGYLRISANVVACPVGFVSPGSTIVSFDYRCSAGWPTDLPGIPVA